VRLQETTDESVKRSIVVTSFGTCQRDLSRARLADIEATEGASDPA